MKGLEIFFPPFDTIVCDPLLKKYLVSGMTEATSKAASIGGFNLTIEEYMPPNSAIFLRDKNIVAVYLNGRLSLNKVKIKNIETLFAGFDFLKGK